MDILLVLPVDENKNSFHVAPDIGLGYLATALRKNGLAPGILHCRKEGFNLKNFENFINQTDFKFIGFKFFTYDYNIIKKSVDVIKRVKPHIPIILGGIHPSVLPEETLLEFPEVDYVVAGEGEIPLPKLIKTLNNGEKLKTENLPGVGFRGDDGKIFFTSPYSHRNLDDFDIPSWDLMPPKTYPPAPFSNFARSFPVAPLISTRGCPYPCAFCAARYITGKPLRYRSAKLVVDEMETLIREFGVREIQFLDDAFTLNKDHVYHVCNEIIKRKVKVHWCCPNGVRLDSLDEDLIYLMKKAGCYSFAVGIESGSQRIVNIMNKKLDLNIVEEKIAVANQYGIKVTGFFILGYPGETKEELKQTLKFSRKLRLSKALFSNFMPLPGTPVYLDLQRQGLLSKENIGMHYLNVAFSVPGVSKKQMKLFQLKAFLGFYLRPHILVNCFEEIRNLGQIKFLLKKIVSLFSKFTNRGN